MAHLVAAGHEVAGIVGFSFATFGICWAWINYSWFASAFDTDDWAYRLLTMLQMIGVVIFSLGLPSVFASLEHGGHIDNRIMVLGYVVMRVGMLFQWLRDARQSPERREPCMRYAVTILIAQVAWVVLALADTSLAVFIACACVLIVIELMGPYLAETRTVGTPWHAHHIAERYGLLAIITLGEGVVGSVVSLEAVTAVSGWDLSVAAFVVASVGITFGLWWIYFSVPFGELLHHRRERPFIFGYSHIILFGAIAAVGAGLHVVAYYLEAHHDPETYAWVTISQTGAVFSVALPIATFLIVLIAVWRSMFRGDSLLHYVELALTVLALAAAVALAAAHAPLALSLVVIALAPAIVVVGYEIGGGHQDQARALERQISGTGSR